MTTIDRVIRKVGNKKTLRLEVSKDDIRLGKRIDACYCAVARSCCRAIGVPMSQEFVGVGDNFVSFGVWYSPAHQSKLGRKASRFVHLFDEGKPVEPATFVIKNPFYKQRKSK